MSLTWVAAKAAMGAANAIPVSTADRHGQERQGGAHGAEGRHDGQVDGRHHAQAQGDPRQVADEHVDDPQGRGQHGEVGRIHLMAPMTGYIASLPPICMAVDAKSPGARKTR